MSPHPNILFLMSDEHRNELVDAIHDLRYVTAQADFRRRGSKLSHGPNPTSDYGNAGYSVETAP